jgi:hypothetical protein
MPKQEFITSPYISGLRSPTFARKIVGCSPSMVPRTAQSVSSSPSMVPRTKNSSSGLQWCDEDKEKLISAYSEIHRSPRPNGETADQFNQAVFESFSAKAPRSERTRKSCIEKFKSMEAWAKFVVSFNNGRVKGSTGRNEFYSESSDDQKNIIAAQPNAKSLQILSEDLSSKMIALMGQTASYDPAAIISNNPIAEGSDSKKGGNFS